MFRTAIVAIFLSLYTLIVGPFLLLHAWITGNPDTLFRAGVAGAHFIARVVGMRIKVEGREKIPPGVAVLLKKSLFSIPLIGSAFRLARFVPVDRGNWQSGNASAALAVEH